MRLLEVFSFTDPDGKSWVTPETYKIDGASIPRALWTLVGSPYTGDYRRASIVHDKACDDASGNVQARRAADRMFYHACRAGGCSIPEATLLYIGVRIGAILPSAVRREERARRNRTVSDQEIEAIFRLAAHQVLSGRTTDDPAEIESRTDRALSGIMGIAVRGSRHRLPVRARKREK